jgi:protein-S-isoprenylcysteine O-methyltransferase Ste14
MFSLEWREIAILVCIGILCLMLLNWLVLGMKARRKEEQVAKAEANRSTYWRPVRWFALFSLFSLFSLFAIPTGNPVHLANLVFLMFLMFLMPAPAHRESKP